MIHRSELEERTTAATDIVDLTARVAAVLGDSGIRDGQVLLFTPGSTAALTTIEDFDNRPRQRRVVVQVSGD